MKFNKRFIYLLCPFMILLSAIGLISKDKTKKIFYLPIGLMGISIILEKNVRRKFYRKNLLKKINSFKEFK